jgi:hypothetical protein
MRNRIKISFLVMYRITAEGRCIYVHVDVYIRINAYKCKYLRIINGLLLSSIQSHQHSTLETFTDSFITTLISETATID